MKDKELIETAMEFAKQSDNHVEVIERLVERIEELQSETKSIVWEPEKSEFHWYVGDDGTVDYIDWTDTGWAERRLDYHNAYKTHELAKKAAKYQQRYNMVLQAVLNLEPDQKVDWKDKDQAKYVVAFDHIEGVWFYSDRYIVDNLHAPLTNYENVQPLLDYLNAKEKSDADFLTTRRE